MKRPAIYSRPAKPAFVPVPKRDWRERSIVDKPLPAPVAVHVGSECHVTPPDVARRMAGYLGKLCGVDVLEPSAGTGNLARAALAAGCDPARLVMVEMHHGLATGLQAVGPVICADFLEWAGEQSGRNFSAILMNPPFSRVKAHMAAAVSLLAAGGSLVALVPITFAGDGFEDLESLPVGTFQTAAVRTKIVFYHA